MSELTFVSGENNSIVFGGTFDRVSVAEEWSALDQKIRDTASAGQTVQLDLAKIEQVDSAGLAALVELTKIARQQKFSLTLINVPESLMKLAKISDVTHLLPLQ